MSCSCENKRLSSDYERIRRLAKSAAKLNGETVGIYKKDDGTFGLANETERDKSIIEYITPY